VRVSLTPYSYGVRARQRKWVSIAFLGLTGVDSMDLETHLSVERKKYFIPRAVPNPLVLTVAYGVELRTTRVFVHRASSRQVQGASGAECQESTLTPPECCKS
jgi:hypothetical protein